MKEILNSISKYKNVIIYGAQIYAYSFYNAVRYLCPDINISCFAVTDLDGNPDKIDNIPVKNIQSIQTSEEALILIAVPEIYHDDIIQLLNERGFSNYIKINSNIHTQFMDKYYLSNTENYHDICSYKNNLPCSKSLSVYMAKCHVDKPLKNNYDMPNYIVPIQVGAALTSERICEITDNIGGNISDKNKNYCELTAIYWLWKNSTTDYIGLCHYRRQLRLPENIISIMEHNNIDAILPTPVLIYPNANAHHARYIKSSDWDNMLYVLSRLYPRYYLAAEKILALHKFYLHNIWILKREHMNNFCQWLFSILFETEKLCEKDGVRADRYMGYIAESLTAIYFIVNENNLNIAHAEELIHS